MMKVAIRPSPPATLRYRWYRYLPSSEITAVRGPELRIDSGMDLRHRSPMSPPSSVVAGIGLPTGPTLPARRLAQGENLRIRQEGRAIRDHRVLDHRVLAVMSVELRDPV